MRGILEVAIPDRNPFYSLYSDGLLMRKTYVKALSSTIIEYPGNAVVILYYTYPAHREACVIRNAESPRMASFPGLSKKASLLFSVCASRADKLKRAAGFLQKNFNCAFSLDDGFYTRLSFLIRARGKLNYPALKELASRHSAMAQPQIIF